MKALSKTMLGAGAAALAAISFAAPAEARHRDRGIDAGDILTGVAIIGGIAAVASAVDRDGYRYGYGYRDRYRGHYNYAVQACAREAQRFGGGQVHITDVDRTGGDRYRVRGIVRSGYGGYGYDRYDRYDRYDYGRFGRDGREDFTCHARGNGRITDFRL